MRSETQRTIGYLDIAIGVCYELHIGRWRRGQERVASRTRGGEEEEEKERERKREDFKSSEVR